MKEEEKRKAKENGKPARLVRTLALASSGLLVSSVAGAAQPDGARSAMLEEVVVTAQKVSQNINDVGMSIDAASGDELYDMGVKDTADLVKIVPGFNHTYSIYGTPIYTIRGVGFVETTLSSGPTVSVYSDEVPIPFAAETKGALLDVRRVEVLKGPQGTLYGQNSTGGAINYIANRPTEQFEAGFDLSYGRFSTTDIQGFVSGPLTDTVRGRLSVRSIQSQGWQESYTRDDALGARDFVNTRLALEWDPSERLRTRLTVAYWQDQSENVAPQFRGIINRTPGTILKDGFLDYPVAPEEPRAADWDPGVSVENDNNFLMTSLRADYDLTSDLTLTSITSYQDYFRDQPLEGDGTAFQNYYSEQSGSIETWYQELRLSGSIGGQGNWIVGLNAQRDETHDRFHQYYADATSAVVLGVLGPDSVPETFQDIDTYAAFANVEYPVLDDVTVQAGIRYTDTQRDFAGCSRDGNDPSNPGWAGQSEAIQQFLRGLNGLTGFTEVPDGGCGTMGPAPEFEPGLVTDELDQDNISWRLNANWNVLTDTLLYANVSQGYKAGSFPTLAIALSRQFEPVTQEKLLAYETGFKASLLESTLQLNGAMFYYDYENKQILGSILDPIFGPLPALVNVPESHVQGFELSAKWAPIEGLRIDPAISYQDSEVDGQFSNFDFTGTVRDFSGESFPVAPEVQANLDVSYRWPLNERWEAFVGAHANYQDSTYSFFGEDAELAIDSYTLIDLRGGIAGERWEFSVWGRNVTDEYYWNNANFTADALVRYAGMPATYGIDMKYRMGQ